MYGIANIARLNGRPLPRFPPWMWRNHEVRAFVDWLRSYNAVHKQTSRVAFHGLDLYSLYDSIRFVLEYLDDVDPKSAEVARERYGCLTPWQSDPATYGHAALTGRYPTCEADVAHALSDLLRKRQAYAAHDGERFLDAVQNARLVYHFADLGQYLLVRPGAFTNKM
jgi:erythromycin esterase-like protein